MDEQKVFYRLQFNNQPVRNDYVQSVPAVEFGVFVNNRQRNLSFEGDIGRAKFITKTFLISRLQ